jgi:hypothetical protein
MSYEIHLTISEDSSGGQLIASIAAREQITIAEAAALVIDQVARRDAHATLVVGDGETPEQLVLRMRAQKAAKSEKAQPPLRIDNADEAIGLFAHAPELAEKILKVVETRSERYAGTE